MPSKQVIDCSKLLAAQKFKIAFAESATAGRMCAEFAMTPNSGDILLGGLTCYDMCVKEGILKIRRALFEKFTPESSEITALMAKSVKKLLDADIVVAVTGLTAPGGSETEEKPVGTMFLHIITPFGEVPHSEWFDGEAEAVVLRTIDKAAELITTNIKTHQKKK
ncbi:MAG: CinA family protein [Flavobacterium sp.]|uniref:CinA family protein n=1 Tax=Flavobacterium sp. TaxID=239 RepID=UPI001201A224|nr:CinA family protein [Flavobacterium sp.]RZJ66302.1 MAG: CinA family protein [Flavobacterium sp.]